VAPSQLSKVDKLIIIARLLSRLISAAMIRAFIAKRFAVSMSLDPNALDTSAPAAIDVPIEIDVAKNVIVLAKPIAATSFGSPRRLINHISNKSTKKMDMRPNELVLAITIMWRIRLPSTNFALSLTA
jgi:hypothetical protein